MYVYVSVCNSTRIREAKGHHIRDLCMLMFICVCKYMYVYVCVGKYVYMYVCVCVIRYDIMKPRANM